MVAEVNTDANAYAVQPTQHALELGDELFPVRQQLCGLSKHMEEVWDSEVILYI